MQEEHWAGFGDGEGRATVRLIRFKKRCKGISLTERVTVSHMGAEEPRLLESVGRSRKCRLQKLCESEEPMRKLGCERIVGLEPDRITDRVFGNVADVVCGSVN